MAATAPQGAAPAGPRIVYVAPGSVLLPKGMTAPPAAQAQGADASAPQGSQGSDPKAAAGPAAATGGAAMIGRIMGVLPIAAGVVQALVGFAITKGTISIVALPLIGGWPKFLVGSLVAATAGTSIMEGVAKLLGKQPPKAPF